MPSAITPPVLAKQLGVNVHKILGWIQSGQLAAKNLGDGTRPRYHILPDDLAAFLAARSARPAPVAARRKAKAETVTNYF